VFQQKITLSGRCRVSGNFQPFESAAVPPVLPMQSTPLAPVSTPASTASTVPPSNVDLLGDLDLPQPSMSMSMSMPVQPNSFASPSATAHSNIFAMTVPASGAVLSPEAPMTFSHLQPNALSADATVPATAPTMTSMESVCLLLLIIILIVDFSVYFTYTACSRFCMVFLCSAIILYLLQFVLQLATLLVLNPLTSSWPHLRCDVGLEEGEYK